MKLNWYRHFRAEEFLSVKQKFVDMVSSISQHYFRKQLNSSFRSARTVLQMMPTTDLRAQLMRQILLNGHTEL